MSKLIATSQMTLVNLVERAIERTDISFWHGLSAVKHPLGVYDCGNRDHSFANEFDVVSGKKYTVRIIAQKTKGTINLKGGIWYTERTSGYQFDGLAALTQVGELSEDGLGIWERTLTVPNGKTKGRVYVQLEQSSTSGFSTAYRVYDAQVFDENGQPLVTDQNNFGALTSPMAAPDGTYIWKRTITYYTDGTNSTVWEYSGVGSKGQDGQNGQTSHVHFAFADNATGGGFSLTTPKAYMGWYADFNESASNDPTKYKWGKWKGDQGAPGVKGDDGKTSYLHLAYASSADGKTGFSFTDTKQQYQGYYTDFTQSSSTDPTKYVWVDRLANVKVGGVNLLKKTKKFDWSSFYGSSKLTDETYQGCAVRYFKNTGTSSYQEIVQFSNCVYPTLNGEYVASFWAKGSGTVTTFFYGGANYLKVSSSLTSQGSSDTQPDGRATFTLSENWERYWVKYKLKDTPSEATQVAKHLLFRHNNNSTEEEIWLAGCKLEEGNVPMPYEQSPEDTQADIDSKADSVLTQEQLNALAEQNSIVKAEMEAKASIDTVNQWITAYQNYVSANDEARAESEKNLQEAAARILQLKTDVGALRQQWDFIDTYMSIQNEGLIIGKSDGSAFAKFANDRISLFSGSSEVMYISQGTLHIENGIFTKTIQIGRFRFETHPADADMLVLRYLGG